jgi:V8-like Glu-specific endopeptidase
MDQHIIGGGRQLERQIVARPGLTAGLVNIGQEQATLAGATIPHGTDGYVPDGVGVHEAQTKAFEAANADRLLEINQELDRIVHRDEVINYRDYPFRCCGKLYVGKDLNFTSPIWTGSAVLVGNNLLMTASHCAPWDPNSDGAMPGWWMRFVPSYHYGQEPYGSSYISDFRGIRNTNNVTGLDYVICRLYSPLGSTCGWLGSKWWSTDSPYYEGSWTSVGYPGDAQNGQVMMVERAIKLHDVDNETEDGRELEAHTFSTPGWSGGPMFGTIEAGQRTVGIMSGKEYERDGFLGILGSSHWHSVSAGGKYMTDLILWAIANWSA